jgi:hypothetical protein
MSCRCSSSYKGGDSLACQLHPLVRGRRQVRHPNHPSFRHRSTAGRASPPVLGRALTSGEVIFTLGEVHFPLCRRGLRMESSHIEQRYRRHQFLGFLSSLLLLVGLIPFSFLLSGAPEGSERLSLIQAPWIFYIAIASALLLGAFALRRISMRDISYREIRDPDIDRRLHDEHERSIRYQSSFRALSSVLFLQGILYAWVMLQITFSLPALPPGLPQAATLIVGHLVFWLPYFQKTK